ncbi:hypothetical protein D3C79_910860 [compost metagenome]
MFDLGLELILMLVIRRVGIEVFGKRRSLELGATDALVHIPAIFGNKPAIAPGGMCCGIFPLHLEGLARRHIQQRPVKGRAEFGGHFRVRVIDDVASVLFATT